MRHDKLQRELDLLCLLAENNCYTVEDVCRRMGISRRNLYYYIEFFKDAGFDVYKRSGCYCISRDSAFFAHLIERISFTEDEAMVLRDLLNKTEQDNALIANMKKKLDRFYDFGILSAGEVNSRAVENIRSLYDAIKLRRQVILRNYGSPHSRSTRDRLVEPFMLMNNNNEVRCFEPASDMNKTFKVSRMQGVEILDTEWNHTARHRQMYTDVFNFTGEERHRVTVTLGQLSHSLLTEEYPHTVKYISTLPDGRRRFSADLCSYAAIGRFVLGLYEDVTVEGDSGFMKYIAEKVKRMSSAAQADNAAKVSDKERETISNQKVF